MVGSHLDVASVNKTIINIRQSITNHRAHEVFETLLKADAVIFAFPLYVFCVPGILTGFLEDYHKFYIEHEMLRGMPKYMLLSTADSPNRK